MTSTSDGSQANAKAFLKDKSQKIVDRMIALQNERMPNALIKGQKESQDRTLRLK